MSGKIFPAFKEFDQAERQKLNPQGIFGKAYAATLGFFDRHRLATSLCAASGYLLTCVAEVASTPHPSVLQGSIIGYALAGTALVGGVIGTVGAYLTGGKFCDWAKEKLAGIENDSGKYQELTAELQKEMLERLPEQAENLMEDKSRTPNEKKLGMENDERLDFKYDPHAFVHLVKANAPGIACAVVISVNTDDDGRRDAYAERIDFTASGEREIVARTELPVAQAFDEIRDYLKDYSIRCCLEDRSFRPDTGDFLNRYNETLDRLLQCDSRRPTFVLSTQDMDGNEQKLSIPVFKPNFISLTDGFDTPRLNPTHSVTCRGVALTRRINDKCAIDKLQEQIALVVSRQPDKGERIGENIEEAFAALADPNTRRGLAVREDPLQYHLSNCRGFLCEQMDKYRFVGNVRARAKLSVLEKTVANIDGRLERLAAFAERSLDNLAQPAERALQKTRQVEHARTVERERPTDDLSKIRTSTNAIEY